VPIVPGLMPIQTYDGFIKMVKMCKLKVPSEIIQALEPIRNNDEAVKEFGVNLGIKMSKELFDMGISAIHFYTLNLERSISLILTGLGFTEKKTLPWRLAPRENENVRPVFWSNRSISYLERTQNWDEFPNGRWGDSRSPAFGELKDYHLTSLKGNSFTGKAHQWGTPETVNDVQIVFQKYCSGEIVTLPWSDSPLQPESQSLIDQLQLLNGNGFLTINSQPRVNGASSTHEIFGWGPKGGYVYQKAYLEFFFLSRKFGIIFDLSRKETVHHILRNKFKGRFQIKFFGSKCNHMGSFPRKRNFATNSC